VVPTSEKLGLFGWTPLHEAARTKSLDVARLLIDRGAKTEGIDLNWMN
jgi:ankyrin repeat protein